MTRHTYLAALLVALLSTTAFAQPYIITGNPADGFTAVRNGATVGTINQPIQTVINFIRSDGGGLPVSIQFGNGGELDIGTESAQFVTGEGTSGTWGNITLSGKITSKYSMSNNNSTVVIGKDVSCESIADIAKTPSLLDYGIVVFNDGGTVTISGGTVSANGPFLGSDTTVYNASGTVNISGGMVSGTNAVYNDRGTVNINGGIVSVPDDHLGGTAVSGGMGTVNISGGTVSSSALLGGTAVLGNMVNITGGTVSATGPNGKAVEVWGTVNITGGTVLATGPNGGVAVYSKYNSTVTISGGTVLATGSFGKAISNYDGTVTITGGEVSATGSRGNAIESNMVTIIDGTVRSSADGYSVYSVYFKPLPLLFLGGSPIINRIRTGTIEVVVAEDNAFDPGIETYIVTLNGTVSADRVVVVNGAAYASNFTLTNPGWGLKVSGNDLFATEIATYTVIFKNWNGSTLKTEKVNPGLWATAPTEPKRTGYTFTGWDKTFNNVTEDIIVTALYEESTPILNAIAKSGFGIVQNGNSLQIVGISQATPIRIYNLRGNVVMSRTAMPNESISVSHLPKGVYVVRAGGKTVKVVR